MKKILIFGAGSIGNHMSNACSELGYEVFVTDISRVALHRMKNFLYPLRYNKWDKRINIVDYKDVFNMDIFFDLIIIGTPPSTHYDVFNLCKNALKFKKILIEKPISNFLDNNIYKIKKYVNKYFIYCGYNHSVNPSFNYFLKLISDKKLIKSISVNWKEGWKGILNAHPWLKSEFSSYLGNYKIGGGAIQEHSHGIHALVCILDRINLKKFNIDKKIIFFKKNKNIKYDYFSSFFSNTQNIFIKYETDLLTLPANKSVRIEYNNKIFIWTCNYQKNRDSIEIISSKSKTIKLFKKTRSSEFVNEIKHIMGINKKITYKKSAINLENSLKVFNLIQKSFK